MADSKEPRKNWNCLKNKLLKDEGFETSSITRELKLKVNEYKTFKGFRKESLRDNIVLLTDLGEIATRDIAESEHPQGFKENMKVARKGRQVANDARKFYEKQLINQLYQIKMF